MRSVIFVLIILTIAILISAFWESSKKNELSNSNRSMPELEQLATKTDDRGQVFVDAKPLKTEGRDWQFEITITTHSIDLSEDLTSLSKLIVDGSEQKPVKWEGSPLGGHHRNGTLFFKGGFSNPKSIKLIIESIGGEKKEFEWIK